MANPTRKMIDPKNVVLKDINLFVKRGEVVVIIGPSGCGKSTFLRCLNGLEKIESGVITIDGLPVEPEKKEITKLRQKIGMVFQSYELFPHKTVLEVEETTDVEGFFEKPSTERARRFLKIFAYE